VVSIKQLSYIEGLLQCTVVFCLSLADTVIDYITTDDSPTSLALIHSIYSYDSCLFSVNPLPHGVLNISQKNFFNGLTI